MSYTTTRELLEVPLDLWAPKILIKRTEDKEIPFQSSVQRGLVASQLIQNMEEIQNVYDQCIKPIIALQNRVYTELENRTISETENLNDEETKLVKTNLAAYIEAIGAARWVIPIEGCIDLSKLPIGFPLPKCLGVFLDGLQ